jgi:hypothetical protein
MASISDQAVRALHGLIAAGFTPHVVVDAIHKDDLHILTNQKKK